VLDGDSDGAPLLPAGVNDYPWGAISSAAGTALPHASKRGQAHLMCGTEAVPQRLFRLITP